MNRNVSLDLLKLLMAFMVIGLHARFLGEFSSLGFYLSVNGLFRLAVPVFLIINGFYFFPVLAKSSQTDWLKRLLILYVIWMLFYSYFWFSIPEFSIVGVIELVKNVVIGYQHLWYVSGMLGAAVLLIVFSRFSPIFLIVSVLISSITGVAIQYLGNYHYFAGGTLDYLFNMDWFHRNAILFSYPFFCIGYLINKYSLYDKVTFNGVALISITGLFVLLLESYFNFVQEGRDGGFDNYISLLFVCPFIFILFVKMNVQGNSKSIALYASAIYFIHSFVLSVLRKFSDLDSIMLTLSCIVVSAIMSYFIIEVNKKFRFIL